MGKSLAWVVLFMQPSTGGSDAPLPQVELRVRMYDHASVGTRTLAKAQETSARIFRHAGIRLVWLTCGQSNDDMACRSPAGRDPVLRILPKAPNEGHFTGVAYADEPERSGGVADMYVDRVEKTVAEQLIDSTEGVFSRRLAWDLCRALVFGVVAAHELGHLMLGRNSHAESGIMQPRWDRRDLEHALFGNQRFTASQEEQLRVNLLARSLLKD